MRLRVKTAIIIIATFICLVGALYLILSSYQMREYLKLEDEEIRLDVGLLENVVNNELDAIDTNLRDWAAWDDTRDFVLGKQNEYVEKNLMESTYANFKLNLIVIMNNERKNLYARGFDLDKKGYAPLPAIMKDSLPAQHPLLNLPIPKSSVKGLWVLPEGVMMVVSQPVINSNDEGPICGTMIMGRWLSDEVVKSLAHLTELKLFVSFLDKPPLSEDFAKAKEILTVENPTCVIPLDEQRIAGYHLFNDVYGKPVLIFKVLQQPRPIYTKGKESIYHQLLSIVVVGLVFSLVIIVLLEAFVIRRLAILNRDLGAISASGNSSGRVAVVGRDELASLSQEINSMLKAIEITQKKDLLLKNHAIESSIYAIAFADPKGTVTYVNPAYVRLLGYDNESEIVGRHASEFSATPELLAMQMEQALNEGSFFDEIQMRRKDATTVPVQVSASLIRDESGNPLCLMASLVDITKRHQAQEALRASEERFRLLSESMPVGIFEIDKDACCVYTNVYWREKFGSMQKLADFVAAIHPADKEVGKALSDSLAKQQDFFREFRVLDKNGKTRWAHFHGSMVKAQNYTHYIGSLIDITERREAEEEARTRLQLLIQADKLIALGTLVSGVAHEINNPINFMELSANILQTAWSAVIPVLDEHFARTGDFDVEGIKYSQIREKIPGMIKNILDGAQRIKNIVADLKSYARHEPMSFCKDVQINDVVKAAVTLTDSKIKKATHKFEVVYGENIPVLTGSPQRLEQVVVNLLLNACEALTGMDQAISLRTSYDPQNRIVSIVARDEGMGISPENSSKILDPFFTTKRERGGVGLGLAVSASIIKEHNGQLRFEPGENRGTKVTLTLPLSGDLS